MLAPESTRVEGVFGVVVPDPIVEVGVGGVGGVESGGPEPEGFAAVDGFAPLNG